tara:strand:+ start:2256 stop:2477 length:222 start_codon:yes stop_codon:yes gene_type:complete
MRTQTQFVQMAHSPTMQGFVEKKLEKLYSKYDWIIRTDVAASNESNFELTATQTINDVIVQIKKRKATMIKHL